MKTNFRTLGFLFLGLVSMVSCNNDDDAALDTYKPTTAAFKSVRSKAMATRLQEFSMTAGTGIVTFTSAKGSTISINGNCLTKNGVAVTGLVDIDFVELFDKGNMLVTNKPTMGIMPDGKKELLLSGGEFFLEATQGGVKLQTTCNINVTIPSNLTGGTKPGMTLWVGDTANEENLAWKRAGVPATGQGGVDANNNNYYVSFGNFGWTNVDKFYSDPDQAQPFWLERQQDMTTQTVPCIYPMMVKD